MPRPFDRVYETTTTEGTGTITLAGAVTGRVTFQSVYAVGDVVTYCIDGDTGAEFEVVEGVLATTTTLTRVTVYRSSNSDALVSLSAGTKRVFAVTPARRLLTHGKVEAAVIGAVQP
jgi:hypothetical protein